jgi:hypothetical protein
MQHLLIFNFQFQQFHVTVLLSYYGFILLQKCDYI